MHDEVKQAIDKGQGPKLRYFFVDSLDVDPTFSAYKDDFEYCLKHNVFEPQRQLTPFRDDESSWDNDYWFNLKVDLQENFSEERMRHMIKVAKIIFKNKIQDMQRSRVTNEQAYIKGDSEKSRRIEKEHYVEIDYSDTADQEEQELEKRKKEIEKNYIASRAKEEAEKKRREALRMANNSSRHREEFVSKKASGVPLNIIIVGVIVLMLIIILLGR